VGNCKLSVISPHNNSPISNGNRFACEGSCFDEAWRNLCSMAVCFRWSPGLATKARRIHAAVGSMSMRLQGETLRTQLDIDRMRS
jgi:hypothetical protein